MPRFGLALALVVALAFSPCGAAKRCRACSVRRRRPEVPRLDREGEWASTATPQAADQEGRPLVGPRELVRLTGVQATELFKYGRNTRRGECMAGSAPTTLDEHGPRTPFRLVSRRRRRSARRRRTRQAPSRDPGQARRPLGRPGCGAAREGPRALFPNGEEWAWNGRLPADRPGGGCQGHRHLEPDLMRQARPVEVQPAHIKVKWNGGGKRQDEQRVDADHEPGTPTVFRSGDGRSVTPTSAVTSTGRATGSRPNAVIPPA